MMLCLLLVVGCLCKSSIHPTKLACWVICVQSQLVLVIAEISVEDQHPKTISVQQLFSVISTYARKMRICIFKSLFFSIKGIKSATEHKKFYLFGKEVWINRFKQMPDLLTFFKCFFGLWIQPVVPHFCYSVIDGVWSWRKLVLGVVVMVTQSRVHLSTWKDRSNTNFNHELVGKCWDHSHLISHLLGNTSVMILVRLLIMFITASSPRSSFGTCGVSSLWC